MVKSEERQIEYCVVVQPWSREHPPICYKGYAKDVEEAEQAIMKAGSLKNTVKAILDVVKADYLIWNRETVMKYWNLYGDSTGNVNLTMIPF